VTLTSKMAPPLLRRNLLERPSHLSEHAPALFTRMSTRPEAADAAATHASNGGPVADVGDHRAARSSAVRHRASVSRSSSPSTSHAQTVRHAGERHAIARPNPCAAPVTIAVFPRFPGGRSHCR
jgi:hypothetical protein